MLSYQIIDTRKITKVSKCAWIFDFHFITNGCSDTMEGNVIRCWYITNDQWESHKNNLLQYETIKYLYNEYGIVSR